MWLTDFYVFQADLRESLTILYLMHLLVKHIIAPLQRLLYSPVQELLCYDVRQQNNQLRIEKRILQLHYRAAHMRPKYTNAYRGGCRDHAIFPVQSCVNTDKLWLLQLTTVSAPRTAPLHSSVLSKSNHTNQSNQPSKQAAIEYDMMLALLQWANIQSEITVQLSYSGE